jgi:hypothetical protein
MGCSIAKTGAGLVLTVAWIALPACSAQNSYSRPQSHCGVPPLRISVPECFNESREGEACAPKEPKDEQLAAAAASSCR